LPIKNKIDPKVIESPFTAILKKGIAEGVIPSRSVQARDWYRNQAKQISKINPPDLMKAEPDRYRQMVVPGRMYMFYYNPKMKKELPYYDGFPLIFPLDVYGDRFLGLNMHYLPPAYRAKLMDALYALANNRYDQTTKLQLSYRVLKAASATRYYKPCVKMYLKRNVVSKFLAVHSWEFDIALFLPTAQWNKAPASQVWADSVNKIKYGKT
jgi:hypothetical protein